MSNSPGSIDSGLFYWLTDFAGTTDQQHLVSFDSYQAADGLTGLGAIIGKAFLYIACVLSGECLDILTELKEVITQFGSVAPTDYLWGAEQLLDAVGVWPILPKIQAAMPWMASFVLSSIPGWGDLFDIASAILGYDPITGQAFTGWERGLVVIAAILPGVTAPALRHIGQFIDDARMLRKTGIWGGTMRQIAAALPEGTIIGIRERPLMAGIWELTRLTPPKPAKFAANELYKLRRWGLDTGLRRMQDTLTNRKYFAHSDIDLQFVIQHGAPIDPREMFEFAQTLNRKIGRNIFRHGDNFSGVLSLADGAKRQYLKDRTLLIGNSGYLGAGSGDIGFAGFLSEEWRAVVQALLDQPNLP